MIEPRADRWSVAWDEVEDWEVQTPVRPTRRAPVDEWTVIDWVDTVHVGPSLRVQVPAHLVPDERCACGHRVGSHDDDGCWERVVLAPSPNRYTQGPRTRACRCTTPQPELCMVTGPVARQLIREGA